LKKEHRSIISGGAMVKGGVFSMYLQHYISDIPFSKGERLFRGSSKTFRQGEQPQGEFKQGEKPQDENGPLPLMSKVES
jgi:hypothetical protein